MPVHSASLLLLGLAFVAGGACAQDTTVIQAENVHYGYAQVMKVTPVYQVLNATRVEQRCASPAEGATAASRLSRAIGNVRERWSERQATAGCRPVPVAREFRRPIAYDVDYVYKGAKYRSRLPDDPGNRLRIRVGVTPVVAGIRDR